MPTDLQKAIDNVDFLHGVFVTMMPDCLLYDSWIKSDFDWVAEDIASYFGDLLRANREALKALQSWSSQMQVTIESNDLLLVLSELESDFVIGFVFDLKAPLGMVRLHTKYMLQRISEILPKFTVEQRPRSVRIVEFVQRYAPDPHSVMLRVSLQTRIPINQLNDAGDLSEEQVTTLETTVCDILGLDALNI